MIPRSRFRASSQSWHCLTLESTDSLASATLHAAASQRFLAMVGVDYHTIAETKATLAELRADNYDETY
jgi:hypothetical protein